MQQDVHVGLIIYLVYVARLTVIVFFMRKCVESIECIL